jgi:hypothetical protein
MTMSTNDANKTFEILRQKYGGDLASIISGIHSELTERCAALEQQVRELQARKR